ncbi:MAG: TRIC cation channel family protein [Oscillospiraceae bacterium]|nr:TRIC cation channel family protein [Oscillospiraceae bacterium]
MNTIIFIIEILGTIAFAVSGVMVAKNKNMDLFGVCMLGITTGCGGGIIRDVIIGNTPPAMFVNPVYALVALATSLIICIPFISKFLGSLKSAGEVALQVLDAVGLGGFTVVAVVNAYSLFPDNIFLMIFVGCVTGCGGGVLRDIFAGDIPYIFRKHIYASASIAGALLCALLIPVIGTTASMICGIVLIMLIRFLAAYYKLNLPRMHN